jgi:hypothetical protein
MGELDSRARPGTAREGSRRAPALMRLSPSLPVSAPVARSPGNGSDRRSASILVLTAPELIRSIPDVVHQLVAAGVEVIFSGPKVKTLRIPDEILAHPRASVFELPLRRTGDAGKSVGVLRAMADLTRFLSSDLHDASWRRVLVARRLLKLLGHPEYDAVAQEAADLQLPRDVHELLSATFREVERLLPPPSGLDEAIERLEVDAVLLVTRCTLGGFEPDVIKVARRLGIPSAMLLFSWDNLSSKAVLNEHPDRLLVWNEVQAREAVELHGIARERVCVVGAANFDRFFAEIEAEQRVASGREREEAARILYLCSSTNVVAQEPVVLARWVAALRASDEPRLREARVVVRPHPKSTKVFESWAAPDERVTLVEPHAKEARLARALAEADLVVALNTSAEIEAAIAGRPVLTFRAGPDAPGQEGTRHFPYLLQANGGFVIDSLDMGEHLRRLAAMLRGEYDRAAVARALERFVRPAGLAQAVSPLVASAVLELARQPAGVTQ